MTTTVKERSAPGELVNRSIISPVAHGDVPRPLWSVMIPTFNCARFLRRTLESVLSQDPGPELMQIEVIDDHSSQDNPERIVREVANGRVGFHRQAQNVGHTRNFETCLQRARGRLVHLLHGDDAVLFGFYGKMAQPFAENPKLGAAFCRNVVIDEEGNWLRIAPLEQPCSGIVPDLLERLAVKQRIQTPAMVVRREVYEILGGFDRRLSWTEDLEMWARVAAHYPVWYEKEPLALYRMHDTSNTSRYRYSGENLRDVERLFKIVEKYVPNGGGKRLCRKGREYYAGWGLDSTRILLARRDFTAAASQVRESLTLCFNFRLLARLVTLFAWAGWRAIVHSIRGNRRRSAS